MAHILPRGGFEQYVALAISSWFVQIGRDEQIRACSTGTQETGVASSDLDRQPALDGQEEAIALTSSSPVCSRDYRCSGYVGINAQGVLQAIYDENGEANEHCLCSIMSIKINQLRKYDMRIGANSLCLSAHVAATGRQPTDLALHLPALESLVKYRCTYLISLLGGAASNRESEGGGIPTYVLCVLRSGIGTPIPVAPRN